MKYAKESAASDEGSWMEASVPYDPAEKHFKETVTGLESGEPYQVRYSLVDDNTDRPVATLPVVTSTNVPARTIFFTIYQPFAMS